MLTPLHSAIDRGEHEKYLFLPLYGNTENSLMTARDPRIDKLQNNISWTRLIMQDRQPRIIIMKYSNRAYSKQPHKHDQLDMFEGCGAFTHHLTDFEDS